MEILHRYLLILLACIALLAGIQVPNLIDQYEKRIDAHLREVTINLHPFQEIANKYFGGSLDKLVELHRKSGVKAFQDEGDAIVSMIKRKQRFETELAAMQVSLPMKIIHLLTERDQEMLDETLAQYTYTVPLTEDALLSGAAAAAMMLAFTELLLALARYIFEIAIPRLRSRFA